MIKDPPSSKVHRPRVIHLYEADLILLLAVKRRFLTTANSLLRRGPFGGLPGSDAMTTIVL
jgi:hypothetical protein